MDMLKEFTHEFLSIQNRMDGWRNYSARSAAADAGLLITRIQNALNGRVRNAEARYLLQLLLTEVCSFESRARLRMAKDMEDN